MSSNMDFKSSGNVKIPTGEYNNIKISGHSRLYGAVRCTSYSSSGTTHGEGIECAERFKASGSTNFSDDIKAKRMKLSGSFSCGGSLVAEEEILVFGRTRCKKNVKCDTLSLSGSMSVDGDVEAESIEAFGGISCKGLVNAESIDIKLDKRMSVNSIGGSKILIYTTGFPAFLKRLFTLFIFSPKMSVSSAIEGDEVTIERVTCPRVTGRVVSIGRGCRVDLVQYSENVMIARGARVGRVEKI